MGQSEKMQNFRILNGKFYLQIYLKDINKIKKYRVVLSKWANIMYFYFISFLKRKLNNGEKIWKNKLIKKIDKKLQKKLN